MIFVYYVCFFSLIYTLIRNSFCGISKTIKERYTRMRQPVYYIFVAFTDIVKETSSTVLWHLKFAWYSMGATHQIYLSVLERDLEINSFRHTWPYLIIEIFVSRTKILKPSCFRTVINRTFNFHTKNVFWLFLQHRSPDETFKELVIELDCVTRSAVQFSKHTRDVSMHSVLAHQISQYYRRYQVPNTDWAASWYTFCKLDRFPDFRLFKLIADFAGFSII